MNTFGSDSHWDKAGDFWPNLTLFRKTFWPTTKQSPCVLLHLLIWFWIPIGAKQSAKFLGKSCSIRRSNQILFLKCLICCQTCLKLELFLFITLLTIRVNETMSCEQSFFQNLAYLPYIDKIPWCFLKRPHNFGAWKPSGR